MTKSECVTALRECADKLDGLECECVSFGGTMLNIYDEGGFNIQALRSIVVLMDNPRIEIFGMSECVTGRVCGVPVSAYYPKGMLGGTKVVSPPSLDALNLEPSTT